MPTYDEVIKQSQANVKTLSEKLKDLDKLHQDIEILTTKANGIPEHYNSKFQELIEQYNSKFQELVELSENYTNTLGTTTKRYLDGNNTLLTSKVSDLTTQIQDLEQEINRLVDIDLTTLFNDLQKIFIDRTREDLAVEMKQFEEKTADFQVKINSLKEQTNRLVDTDFRGLFNDLQKAFIDQTRTDLAVELKRFEEKSKYFQAKIDSLGTEISRLVNTDFTKLFRELQRVFIDQTRTDLSAELDRFEEKSKHLQTKIDSLGIEISRLVNTDFANLFRDLQKVFIDQTRIDLSVELKRFEEKATDLQDRNSELKKQIERLEGIDFEKHFDKLQRILAEIFGAINAINLTLTNLVQTLTGIAQSLGTIKTTLDENSREAKEQLDNFSKATAKHLADQDKQAAENVELLRREINTLSEENKSIKEELKSNRAIQLFGLTIILAVLIYIAVNG